MRETKRDEDEARTKKRDRATQTRTERGFPLVPKGTCIYMTLFT